ncbi:MAG: DUF1127 domain-containing protein [Paracoccaceae bacterium]|nr:DUF1127 domain-containing protein [Paracoccaceae bacterium]
MAYQTETLLHGQSGLSARLAALTADLRARFARRQVFRTTVRELSALSDRELADLGLNRSVIRRVAYQAAYEV